MLQEAVPPDPLLDLAAWQAMAAREAAMPPDECIGLLRRADFVARSGALLLWRDGAPCIVPYAGDAPVAVLLVAADAALPALQQGGLAAIPALVRRGQLHPYMLKTLAQLADLGMEDFVEDLGLVFPKH